MVGLGERSPMGLKSGGTGLVFWGRNGGFSYKTDKLVKTGVVKGVSD
jgi:hypothetical protein